MNVEQSEAFRQALEENFVDGLASVRTWTATLLLVGMAALMCIAVTVPQLQSLWRVDPSLVFSAMLIVSVTVICSTWFYKRHGALHPTHIRAIYLEAIAAMLTGVILIYESGSAASVFWFVLVAQIFNIAQRPLIRTFSLRLEGSGIVLLTLLFVFFGQWWDGLVTLVFGSVCLWLLWIILDGQLNIIRSNTERKLIEQRLQSLLVERERKRIARDLHEGWVRS